MKIDTHATATATQAEKLVTAPIKITTRVMKNIPSPLKIPRGPKPAHSFPLSTSPAFRFF
jgi:hypothetical protein